MQRGAKTIPPKPQNSKTPSTNFAKRRLRLLKRINVAMVPKTGMMSSNGVPDDEFFIIDGDQTSLDGKPLDEFRETVKQLRDRNASYKRALDDAHDGIEGRLVQVVNRRLDDVKNSWSKYASAKHILFERTLKLWNLYADSSRHHKREFCNGVSKDKLEADYRKDNHSEMESPGAYALAYGTDGARKSRATQQQEQRENTNPLHNTFKSTTNTFWNHKGVYETPQLRSMGPMTPSASGDGSFPWDRSFPWMCFALYYYPKQTEIINDCWVKFKQFADQNGSTSQSIHGQPFVCTEAYKTAQNQLTQLDTQEAPNVYSKIQKETQLPSNLMRFLGNGEGFKAFTRFLEFNKRVDGASDKSELFHAQNYRFSTEDDIRYESMNTDEEYAAYRNHHSNQYVYKMPEYTELKPSTMSLAAFLEYVFDGDEFDSAPLKESKESEVFKSWLGRRKSALVVPLYIMAGDAIPNAQTTANPNAQTTANNDVDRAIKDLWTFLEDYGWEAWRLWRQKQNPDPNARFSNRDAPRDPDAPFSIYEHVAKEWFAAKHFDEYDQWANGKWGKSNANLPRLYELMKRRHSDKLEEGQWDWHSRDADCIEVDSPKVTKPGTKRKRSSTGNGGKKPKTTAVAFFPKVPLRQKLTNILVKKHL